MFGWFKKAKKLAPKFSLDAYMEGPLWDAAVKAVKKQESDPVLAGADVNIKRDEALQWVEHYAGKKLARRDAWLTRFVVELAVGFVKGKLRDDSTVSE